MQPPFHILKFEENAPTTCLLECFAQSPNHYEAKVLPSESEGKDWPRALSLRLSVCLAHTRSHTTRTHLRGGILVLVQRVCVEVCCVVWCGVVCAVPVTAAVGTSALATSFLGGSIRNAESL